MEYDERKHTRIISGVYQPLFSTDIKVTSTGVINSLTSMPGFVKRVTNVLTEYGYEINYIDERTPFPVADHGFALTILRDYQLEAAYTAIASKGGVVSCPTGWGKGHLIGAIIKAFDPTQLKYRNTPLSIVVAPNMDTCRNNYNELKKIFGKEREVGLVMTGYKEFSDDIQVITFDSLHHINPDEIGILIVDEVHEAATDKRADLIISAKKALRWGMSATPLGRFDGGDVLSEGLFGPLIFHSSYSEGVNAGALVPITVYQLKCPEPSISLDKYKAYKRRTSKYQYGVEDNKNLNKQVVELYNKIPKELQALCIIPHLNHMNNMCEIDNTLKTVHAETSELKLKENRYHNLINISRKEREKIYDDFACGDIRKIISTYVYKQGVNFPGLTVMLCPGGGGSEIIAGQMPGRASRAGVEGKDKAYIVDWVHEWDTYIINGMMKPGPLLRDDKARQKVYKKLKFEVIKIDSIDQLPFIGE
ncbi:DEAD/DEAH box helicase [Verrucomicrobiota bacterium]